MSSSDVPSRGFWAARRAELAARRALASQGTDRPPASAQRILSRTSVVVISHAQHATTNQSTRLRSLVVTLSLPPQLLARFPRGRPDQVAQSTADDRPATESFPVPSAPATANKPEPYARRFVKPPPGTIFTCSPDAAIDGESSSFTDYADVRYHVPLSVDDVTSLLYALDASYRSFFCLTNGTHPNYVRTRPEWGYMAVIVDLQHQLKEWAFQNLPSSHHWNRGRLPQVWRLDKWYGGFGDWISADNYGSSEKEIRGGQGVQPREDACARCIHRMLWCDKKEKLRDQACTGCKELGFECLSLEEEEQRGRHEAAAAAAAGEVVREEDWFVKETEGGYVRGW